MATISQKIMPCLWFDTQAEAAAKHYVSIFKNSKLGDIMLCPNEGREIHGKEPGSVLTVEFELEGTKFLALNGGPRFTFDEAISFQVLCETQDEVDYFWRRLAEGGSESHCGWLKDKFGLSWQITPAVLIELMKNPKTADGVMKAMLQMRKLDIAALKKAANG